jgi:hypothetical protein
MLSLMSGSIHIKAISQEPGSVVGVMIMLRALRFEARIPVGAQDFSPFSKRHY